MTRLRSKTIPAVPRKDDPIAKATPEDLELLDLERPVSRGDCEPGGINEHRPCPYVSCKHHLYIDVNPETGSLRLVFPNKGVEELEETCALDVAASDGATLERVGELTSCTRERIRQIEVRALLRLKYTARRADLSVPEIRRQRDDD